jgi:glycosyltransferase involved in cell wall biosynthesis
MPRILRIINRFNLGGPTYNATFLTRYLSADFETLLVGGLPEEDETDSLHIPRAYGVEPLLIPEMQRNPNFRSDRKAYKRIKEIIADFKPDIVHTHAGKAGALGRRAAYKSKVPIIVHTYHGHVFHSYFGKMKTAAIKQIERRLATYSTGIIAISEQQKYEIGTLHKICPPEKITVIPLGFDLQRFHDSAQANREAIRAQYRIADHEVAVAIVGRLAPVKNHAFFLDALDQLMAYEKLPLRVFIVGDGSERGWIAERVAELNARHGQFIEMTSWIMDIAAFNAGMDVIALSSHNEGTPVSLIEAQAGGVPVLSTDVGGVRDIVVHGETGFITPSGDLVTYVEKLRILIKDSALRKRMSAKGWIHVRDAYHYTTLVKNMEGYYRRVMG